MIEPWVGRLFRSPENVLEGLSLLVVGESGHSDKDPVGSRPPNLVKEAVERYLAGENFSLHRSVTKWVSGAAGRGAGDTDKQVVWDSIAFTNLVDQVSASYSREPREKEVWRQMLIDGGQPLVDLIRELKPNAILFVGKEASGWFGRHLGIEQAWDQKRYDIEGIPVAWVHHSSSSASTDEQRVETLKRLLADARSSPETAAT